MTSYVTLRREFTFLAHFKLPFVLQKLLLKMHTKRRYSSALTLMFLVWGAGPAVLAAQPVLQVRQIFATQENSSELSYKGEVLKLVLDKSQAKYGPYKLVALPSKGMTQSRAFRELERGALDVVASMTDVSREEMAIPIRYCIYKGLLGLRVGMGMPETVHALNKVTTREALNAVELGQVFDWPDYEIQRANGLRVTRLNDFASGIYRLKKGNLALFPLGVVEVEDIAKAQGLSVVSQWALAYPTAYYFFVSSHNPELAERLRYGFEQAIKDRSFDNLFARRLGPKLQSLGLEKRQLFFLNNPQLPKTTPLERKELWHPLFLNRLQHRAEQ